jgi:ParB family chromosome partitioning protein
MGSIDTDPASNDEAQEQIRAETYYTAEDDGLTREWFGNIWLNPPRSTELVSRFAEQLISELSAGHIRSAIVLVDNATDTAWFQMLTARSSAVCFHAGPVRFTEAGNKRSVTPKHGQVIVYYGPDTEKFYDVFSIMGNVFKLM